MLENEEKTPLILGIEEKGRCWCCWETDDSNDNRLIRACHGCKDVDLQWIHQNCIDQYISLLPQDSDDVSFYCTRCKDPYKVESILINPLITLTSDKSLLVSVILTSICTLLITIGAIDTIKLVSHNGSIDIFGIPLWIITVCVLGISHLCNAFVWVLAIKFCSRKFKRHVVPLEKQFESA